MSVCLCLSLSLSLALARSPSLSTIVDSAHGRKSKIVPALLAWVPVALRLGAALEEGNAWPVGIVVTELTVEAHLSEVLAEDLFPA